MPYVVQSGINPNLLLTTTGDWNLCGPNLWSPKVFQTERMAQRCAEQRKGKVRALTSDGRLA